MAFSMHFRSFPEFEIIFVITILFLVEQYWFVSRDAACVSASVTHSSIHNRLNRGQGVLANSIL